MGWRRLIATRPLTAALAFEGLMIPVALVLAWALGVQPWPDLRPTLYGVLGGIGATVPLVGILALSALLRPGWFADLENLVRPLIDSLLRGRGPWAVVAVAALAGLGEELLFRGVLQSWLAGFAWPATAVALAAVAFGLAHAVTRAYFVLATVMGLYLGALYQATGDLLLVCLVHGLYDGIALVYLLRTAPPRRRGHHEAQ